MIVFTIGSSFVHHDYIDIVNKIIRKLASVVETSKPASIDVTTKDEAESRDALMLSCLHAK